jgi:hypothetical protein
MESMAHCQIVQRETNSGIEVFKYLQLFFNLENYKMCCCSGLWTGPLLFNIYIKDVPSSTDVSSNVTMYANDTGILVSNNCYEELNRNFNKVLYNSLKWFQTNQLVLIMEKTKIVKSNPTKFSHSALHTTCLSEQVP